MSSSNSICSEDLDSDIAFSTGIGSTGVGSTGVGSTFPELNLGGTDDDSRRRDELTISGILVDPALAENEDVAIALPPTESDGTGEYHEIALTGSAALDVLDQLIANNAIGKEKAAKLRRKYNFLRDTLESSRVTESNLLDKAKTLAHQLAYQRRVLEKGASFPEGSTSQSSHLRQIQLTHQNELDMCQTRINQLDTDIEQLSGEHELVTKEFERLPKKEELEQHIKELTKSADELNDEISLRSLDLERYHADVDKRNFRISVINQETEELHQMQDALQQDLIVIRNGPNITKDIEIARRQNKETQQESKDVNQHLRELMAQIAEAAERNSTIKDECISTAAQLRKERDVGIEKEVGIDQLSRHIMIVKEREACLLEDKANLEIRERHRLVEIRGLHDAHVGKTKEKERELKALKKVDMQLSSLKQSTEQVQRQVTVVEERKAKQAAECERISKNRAELRKEVDLCRRGLQYLDGITDEDHVKLNQKLAAEDMTKRCAKHLREKVHNLNKDIIAMTKARDNECRLYFHARKECKLVEGDLHTKEAYIRDHQKKIREVEAELMDCMHAYEVVKNERNKTHSQILVMQQVSAELADKSKILANEIDINHAKTVDQDKELQTNTQSRSHLTSERDLLRLEWTKVKIDQSDVDGQLDTLKESIHKLINQIKNTEQHLNRLRRRYEQTVQERNDLGLQLIERNDEMCMFYEKMNMQKSVIRKANLKLASREEELKFLNDEIKRHQNDIFVFRKKLPEQGQLKAELVGAQVEFKEREEEVRRLEKAVEDASDFSRLRLLPGDNPTRDELNQQLDKVEGRLAECEQQLLEKELLFEQVCKITDRANYKVGSQRASTLAVAKKVNNYQARIKDVTRKMMALVSELSMQQASSLHMEQDVKELESRLQQAYTHMENGEAPDQHTQAEWERMLQDQFKRKHRLIEKMNLEEEQKAQFLAGGMMTSAEPRPNAYVPSGAGELPVPKPYGSHPPFKPSQHGANLRHIRKPQPQPIDI